MAVDLIVTDEAIEDPLVLKRLLSDIIERLSNTVLEVPDPVLINQIITVIQKSGAGLPSGGTAGQILGKLSNKDGDVDWIDLTTPINITEYCPGYTYVFVSTTQFKIEGLNVSALFYVGRSLRIIDNGMTLFGEITVSSFSTDTTITVSLLDAAILTINLTEVCFVAGTIQWDVISDNPSGGEHINRIIAGRIGNIIRWIIVGDEGLIATSDNKGLTWLKRNAQTFDSFLNKSLNLTCIAYDPINQRFMVGGQGGIILTSINGINWIRNDESLPDLSTGSFDDVLDVEYHINTDTWGALFQNGDGSKAIATSTDFGISFIYGATTGLVDATKIKRDTSTNDSRIIVNINQDLVYYTDFLDTAYTVLVNVSSRAFVNGWVIWTDGATNRIAIGRADGNLDSGNYGSAPTIDDVLFSYSINEMASSDLHKRIIAVGDNGQIGYLEWANWGTPDSWVGVSNGFNPNTNINDIYWDEEDQIFIAVADNGQIARSTTGIT